MQIFIKGIGSKTIIIEDVGPGTTIREVKEEYVRKLGILNADSIKLFYGVKLLIDGSTFGFYQIEADSELHAKVKREEPRYDPVTKFALRRRLEVLFNKRCFLFIGLGSYDHGHGEETIRRQQCPPYVLSICRERKLSLNIILVDSEFKTLSSYGCPQIYDIEKRWKLKYVLWGNKVRHFMWGMHKLSTYTTSIKTEEYGGTRLTLAGINLIALATSISESGGCFVSGNFYSESNPPFLKTGF